jgi:hypothetical protein
MVRRAESGQAKRVKIDHTSGELEASEHVSQAAAVIATRPIAVSFRHLQTLTEIASDTNSSFRRPSSPCASREEHADGSGGHLDAHGTRH